MPEIDQFIRTWLAAEPKPNSFATQSTVGRWGFELWQFGAKQAYACIFGAYLLALIVLTHVWYPFESLARYDFLFCAAVFFQIVLLVTRLESIREALVILVFHALATGMEVFKTSDAIQSWMYPEAFVFGIGNVPLFAGFMYSAVGSYIARVWRLFDFQFSHYPPLWTCWILAGTIYVNFFSHHFVWDVRWLAIACVFALFWRVTIYFKVGRRHRRMPLILGWGLVALFIWIAENLSTYGAIWVYPSQADGWSAVPVSKLFSWFLLMIMSFVLISVVRKPVVRSPVTDR